MGVIRTGPENVTNEWLNWCSAKEMAKLLWKFIWFERAWQIAKKRIFLVAVFMALS